MLRIAVAALLLAGAAPGAEPTLIVLQKGASSLAFYSLAGERQGEVPVGLHPHEMALSADRRLAYITDNGVMRTEEAGTGGNTISIVDVIARSKIGEISLHRFRRPHGIDLDHKTGLLAVTTELPDKLLIVDVRKRSVVRTYDTQGKTSHMVVWGHGARWAYVSNSGSGTVAAVDTATGEVRLIHTGARPEGSALSPHGRLLYVGNRDANTVTIIDTSRQSAIGDIPTGDGPVRIAVTSDGRRLLCALNRAHKIQFIDPAARRVTAAVTLGAAPVSMTISPDGELAFASAQDQDTVYVVSVAEGKVIREIHTARGSGPDPVLEVGSR